MTFVIWPFVNFWIRNVSHSKISLLKTLTLILSIHEYRKVFFENVTFRTISFEIFSFQFWKHTFQELYISTFDGPVLFALEKYCFEIVSYDNISINVFIFSRQIICILLSFLKFYIRDFIRLKKIRFVDIVMWDIFFSAYVSNCTRREFLREILYKNIAIIAIQHGKMCFVDTFGYFSYTIEWHSLKSVWQISQYTLA